MTRIRLALMLYFMVAHKLHAKACRRLSWSLWRHGRDLAGAGDISHRGFLGWRSALWGAFLLWSLPILQRWSSPLVASICSVHLQHDFAWLTDNADRLVVPALLQVAFLGSTWLAILLSARSCCRLSWRAVTTSFPPVSTSSAGMLATTSGDLPFFNYCTAASIPLRRRGWSSSVSVWRIVQCWYISIVVAQLRRVFCPSAQYLPFFYETFIWTILDRSSLSLFHNGQVFQELVCPFTVCLSLDLLLFRYFVLHFLFQTHMRPWNKVKVIKARMTMS